MTAHQATVTRKGQITIPAGVRRRLHLAEGDRVEFEELGDAVVVRRATAATVTERTAGSLSRYADATPPPPVEERDAFERLVANDVVASMEEPKP